ncbi:MAG: hypothetical protein JXA97_11495 [Anaerolineales bacterium]|nr:hypothetical protein [Anaerolineales bacterium]
MIKRLPVYRSLLIASLILAFLGSAGLVLVMTTTLPTVGPRWLFFFFLSAAATGICLPFIWYLHRRFSRGPDATPQTMLRQGLWSGFFITMCVWLQINRSLNLAVIFLMIVAIAAVEWLLQLVRRPRRKLP